MTRNHSEIVHTADLIVINDPDKGFEVFKNRFSGCLSRLDALDLAIELDKISEQLKLQFANVEYLKRLPKRNNTQPKKD